MIFKCFGNLTESFIYYLVLLSLMESITIKVSQKMANEIEKFIEPRYSTKSEFIREAIRERMRDLEKEKALKNLEKYFGASKRKTTDKELERAREKAWRELVKERGWD